MTKIKLYKPIIIGLGNPLLQDEGFGLHVLYQLMRMHFEHQVEFIDGGTDGLNLLDAVERAQHLLVIDTVDAGKPPGTLYSLQEKDLATINQAKLSPHQLGFLEVLALAKFREHLPPYFHLIGVQPESLDWGLQLTPVVSNAVPIAIKKTINLLDQWSVQAIA